MRIINNVSNVTAEFEGLPSNFVSNNVQTIINDPIVPECKCDICFFFDFCCGCFFNPCDCIRFDNSCPFPEPINPCHDRCHECGKRCRRCGQRKMFIRKSCNCNKRHFC